MKTSDQLWAECEDILKLLKNCMQECYGSQNHLYGLSGSDKLEDLTDFFFQNGWKARYFGTCSKLESGYSKCRMKHFEQKRLEHNLKAKQNRGF